METKKYIEELKKNFVIISKEQEKAILNYWGKNIGNEYTKQDIYEQTRKVIDKYEKLKF